MNPKWAVGLLLSAFILSAAASDHLPEVPHVVLGQDYMKLDFSTTNPNAAQHCLIGLAFMHSFEYTFAKLSYENALKHDPACVMCIWGLAMINFKPIWEVFDYTTGRNALDMLPNPLPETTLPFEKRLIEAAGSLFPKGSDDMRPHEYINAMRKVADDYPLNDEAQTLFALSLFYITTPESRGRNETARIEASKEAATRLQTVLTRNLRHPGALHYTVHNEDYLQPRACDAIKAGYGYEQVAIASAHAQHMIIHLLMRCGLWEEAATRSWTSTETLETVSLQMDFIPLGALKDFHQNDWLQYFLLQTGRWALARSETEALYNLIHLSSASSAVSKVAYIAAWTRFILETASYKEADESTCGKLVNFIEMPSVVNEIINDNYKKPDKLPISGPNACGSVIRSLIHESQVHFACGMSAAQLNNPKMANQHADEIDKLAKAADATECNPYTKMTLGASALQIRAIVAKFSSPDPSSGLKLAGEAVDLEEKASPPPAGPPIDPVLPSGETVASLLYAEGQYALSNQYYEKVLAIHPNRTQSLLGLARTYAALGGPKNKEYISLAIRTYENVLRQLTRADLDLTFVSEAQQYISSHSNVTSQGDCDNGLTRFLRNMVKAAMLLVVWIGVLFVIKGVSERRERCLELKGYGYEGVVGDEERIEVVEKA